MTKHPPEHDDDEAPPIEAYDEGQPAPDKAPPKAIRGRKAGYGSERISPKVLNIARETNNILCHHILKFHSALGFHEYIEGVWEPRSENDIMSYIHIQLGPGSRYRDRREIFSSLMTNHTVYLRSKQDFNEQPVVVLNNGAFNTELCEFVPMSPDHLCTIRIPLDYDATAECPRWLQHVQETVDEPMARLALQEYFGYCLTADCVYQKSLFLIGLPNTGKSVILDVLRDMLGMDNISALNLYTIAHDLPAAASLYGKLSNICTEIKNVASEIDLFLRLVDGGSITARNLFKDYFTFKSRAKFAFSMNDAPTKVSDSQGQFLRRVLYLQCNNVCAPEKRDIHLPAKLRAELPGIFRWAVLGLKRLNERQQFTETQDMRMFGAKVRADGNHIADFIGSECIVSKLAGRIELKTFFIFYSEWFKVFGKAGRAYDIGHFKSKIIDAAEVAGKEKGETIRVREVVEQGVKFIENIKLKPEAEDWRDEGYPTKRRSDD